MPDIVTFEEQVILAAKFKRASAIDYLLMRWEQPKNRLITALARRYGLSEHDAADARQEAVLWLLDAIRSYRFAGHRKLRPQRMKAFLRSKLKRAMSNFVRGLRRQARIATACRSSDDPLCVALWNRSIRRNLTPDPAVQCAEDDLQETVRRAIAALGSDCGQLFEILLNGGNLREAAGTLHITYHAARVRRVRIDRALAPLRTSGGNAGARAAVAQLKTAFESVAVTTSAEP
ncbi:MAG: hypothetical protein ABI614_23675 [Planctomycetota bacterium]